MTDDHVTRSLVYVRPIGSGFEFLCDCVMITQVELEVEPGATSGEFAVTCDGCQSAYWFTWNAESGAAASP